METPITDQAAICLDDPDKLKVLWGSRLVPAIKMQDLEDKYNLLKAENERLKSELEDAQESIMDFCETLEHLQ
jgi:hypothetical protein